MKEGSGLVSNYTNNNNNDKELAMVEPPTAQSMTRFVSLSNMYIQSSDSLRGGSSGISSLLSGSSWTSIPNATNTDAFSEDIINNNNDDIERVLPEGWNDAPPLFAEHEENIVWIKTMIRQGIPLPLRCAVWLSNVVLVVHHDLELAKEFRTLSKVRILDHTYATVLDQQVGWRNLLSAQDASSEDAQLAIVSAAPTFGNHDWDHHLLLAVDAVTGGRLPMAGQLARTKVLLALESTLGMEYSPMLPTLVSILLMAMSESYAFYTVREMLHAPGYLTPYYVATNPMEYLAQARAFADVLTKLHPQTAQTMLDIGILPRNLAGDEPGYNDDDEDDDNPAMGLAPIFQDFFVSLLPFPQVLRIMDIFTLEGIKVMFRVGVALVCLFQRDCTSRAREIQTSNEWWDAVHDYTHNPSSPYQFDVLLKKSYGVHGHVMQGSTGGPPLRRGTRRRILRQQPIRFPNRYILARIMKMEEEQVRVALAERRLKYPMSSKASSKSPWLSTTARPLGLIDHFSDVAAALSPPQLTAAVSSPAITATASSMVELQTLLETSHSQASIYQNRPAMAEKEIPRPILGQSIPFRTLLAQWLPLSLRFTNLDLLFSTNFHGRSLERFYSQVQNTSKTILLAQVLVGASNQQQQQQHDDDNHRNNGDHVSDVQEVVIGMYASQPWKPTPHVYGDGECFLFRLTPDPQVWKWNPRLPPASLSSSQPDYEDDEPHDEVSFFLPTTAAASNRPTPTPQQQHHATTTTTSSYDNTAALREQFMVATSQYISMGANSDGSCGLRLNEDLTRGASSTALGFDNDPLVPNTHEVFEIGLVEVYRLVRQFDGHA